MVIKNLALTKTYGMALPVNYIEKMMWIVEIYFFIHSFTFGTRNKAKAMQGIKTHRAFMLYPDKLKKNDINPATKPTTTINPLQPII